MTTQLDPVEFFLRLMTESEIGLVGEDQILDIGKVGKTNGSIVIGTRFGNVALTVTSVRSEIMVEYKTPIKNYVFEYLMPLIYYGISWDEIFSLTGYSPGKLKKELPNIGEKIEKIAGCLTS